MKKIMIALILLLVVSGCSLFNKGGSTTTITDSQIHTGNEGLVISFMKGSPPSDVSELEEFPIYILAENKGAADVLNGYITLGFQQDYIQSSEGSAANQNFNLKGKSLANPAGEQQTFRFMVNAKDIIGDTRTVPISVSSCYSYNTIATESVCIDTDVYNVKAVQKACSVADVTLKNGQGGPIAITKIEPKMLASEGETTIIPQFSIEVENKGAGNVVKASNALDLCSAAALSKDILNVVEVSVSLAGQELSCDKNVLKLDKNKDTIICRLESGIDKSAATYVTLLRVQFQYGYSQTITKNININKRI